MRVSRAQNGDTIIEVLFAITIFSLVAVGGLSLMNQGTGLAQRALEISLVRQQIDAQADALKYLNRAYVSDYGQNGPATERWNSIVSENAVDTIQVPRFETVADGGKCNLPGTNDRPFALDITKLDSDPILFPTSDIGSYAKVRYESDGAKAEGIWVQAVRSATRVVDGIERPGFYDFHIRACWYSPGQDIPVVSGTIVRLYEPRG